MINKLFDIRSILFALIAMCSYSTVLRAEFVLTIGKLDGSSVVATPGQTFLIPIYASASSGTISSVESFSMAIDVGNTETLTNYFSEIKLIRPDPDIFGSSPDSPNTGLYVEDGRNASDPLVVDFVIVGTFLSPKEFSASKTKLFDLQFKAPLTGATGKYDIKGVVDENVSYYQVGVDAPPVTSFVNGSMFITITAVPEPSSLALVGLVSVSMCLARRRRASV